jgi:hypothetical protein
MTDIPFPFTSAPGQLPQDSAGRLVNAFAEPLTQGARAPFKIRRAPGLRQFGASALGLSRLDLERLDRLLGLE